MKNLDPETITNRMICFISLLMGGAFGFFYGISYWRNGLLGLIVGLIIGISAYFIALTIKRYFAKMFLGYWPEALQPIGVSASSLKTI